MDKILLIDFLNQVHRGNVNFGKQEHVICSRSSCYAEASDYDHLKHKLAAIPHCTCGQSWNQEDGRCVSQVPDEYTIVYSFFRSLRVLVELFKPDKLFFVLEGHPQFRYNLFADYKGNRKIIKEGKAKDGLEKVFRASEMIIELLQDLPTTIVRAEHYECDDVISTLSRNMADEEVVIISNDSDYIQLLQDKSLKAIKIYNPIKKEFMKAPTYPYLIWKCLNGDKSDNIPALLTKQKALNCSSDPKLFSKFMDVEENRANFNVNKDLIEFRNVPEEEMIIINGHSNFDKLKEKFSELKFESIVNDKSWDKFVSTFECVRY